MSASHPIEVRDEAGVRTLHFGSEWVQGAMRVRRPFALELVYTRELAAGLALRAAPWPRQILLIGLGAGSLAKFFHRALPAARLTVVEIDPRIPVVAHTHFRLPPEDARLRVVIADGADYVAATTRRWDLIVVDGFDHLARAGMLDSAPFYAAARAALSEQGLLAANFFGQRRGFKASLGRLEAAFDRRVLAPPPCESGNVAALALVGAPCDIPVDTLAARIAQLKDNSGLDLRPWFKRLHAAGRFAEGGLRV